MTESQEATTKARRTPASKKPRAVKADSSTALASTAPAPAARPSAAEIAARAYDIYVRRGRVDGRDQEDWLLAEAELGGPRV
jgi:hypothetical protein